jgi:hypothetical protein
MAQTTPSTVLARYQNYVGSSDDLIAHCLIRHRGDCVQLTEGKVPVTVDIHHVHDDLRKELVRLLEEELPVADWPPANYDAKDYRFIVELTEEDFGKVAVYGEKPAGSKPQYYSAPIESPLGRLVKKIANIDEPPVG